MYYIHSIFLYIERDIFSAKFLVRRWTRTPCAACLKKDTIPLYV